MCRPADHPELSEHLRRDFRRDMRSRIEATRAHAVADQVPSRRESRRRHERALAAARTTYNRVWERLEAERAAGEGNR